MYRDSYHVSIIEGIKGNSAIFLFFFDHVTEDSCGSTVDHEFRLGETLLATDWITGASPHYRSMSG